MMHRMYKPVTESKKIMPISDFFVKEIVSGGQTGVDRAAHDAARKSNIPQGGWCPKERKAEDGVIPDQYNLKETPTTVYEERTEWNARDSDGTLIIVKDEPMGGTFYTIEMAKKHNKPFFLFELNKEKNLDKVAEWVLENRIQKLNIAGPRASQTEGIYDMAYKAVDDLLTHKLLNQDQFQLRAGRSRL
jgi:predicted Rossmann-fold nucleotide-binding protein